MIKYLEKLLYDKTLGSQSEILYAQWNYDKKVIPNALNVVSNLFPHFSLHDESHSITIINNIVRILGIDKIEKLSAIDIWLILEASYSHDIGMVVSYEKITNELNSIEFVNFFKELQKDSSSSLNEFANSFVIENNKINYKSIELNLEYHDGIKFILAEYFRRIHSERSKEIISDPDKEQILTSPRIIIPKRIFKILADICSSHTKNFDEVMMLPFSEVGIDIENSHPRFIACLLRIGDLLDLDNNRFSEVMLKTLSRLPIDTLNHMHKHLSIESFRVDQNIIDVYAKCNDYEVANITQHWFNYLNSEITQQMSNWSNIVPSKEIGYLPTIGNLKVELEGYDYIDGKNKPSFSIDTKKALELLQGSGIYETPFACIKELLQNAVDSTLLRTWLEYENELISLKPNSQFIYDTLLNFPIKVRIKELIGSENDGKYKSWKIEIEDKGIGVSIHDLKFLSKTGSSSKNTLKYNLIEKMPIWLRPSGNFGIGFQSIFMLTDQVLMESKSYFTESFLEIKLNNPNSKNEGSIYLKKIKTNYKKKPGTKISFLVKTDKYPTRWALKGTDINTSELINNFDPFLNKSLDIEITKIFDEIISFSNKSIIPIYLSVDDEEIELFNDDIKFDFFDDETSLEFSFRVNDSQHNNSLLFYKNQPVEIPFNFRHIDLIINIHGDVASNVLELNRNKVQNEYRGKLYKDILIGSFNQITQNFNIIFETESSKIKGSLFLHDLYCNIDFLQKFDISGFNQWENHKVYIENKPIELKKLIDNTKKLIVIHNSRYDVPIKLFKDKYSFDKNILTIELRGNYSHDPITEFLFDKLRNKFNSFSKSELKGQNKTFTYFSGIESFFISDNEILEIIKESKGSSFARSIIPCSQNFPKLRIKDDVKTSYITLINLEYSLQIKFPKMLSPFVRYNDGGNVKLKSLVNQNIYDWVFKNRFDNTVSIEEIKEEYSKFIDHFNPL